MDRLPNLKKDANRCISSDFVSFMRGSEKRDCEIVAPAEVIQRAFEQTVSIIDTSVMQTAYMMEINSCLNEILCTLPVLWNCQGRMSHITKTDNSGYHAVSLDGVVVAEFTITPLYSESSIAFERSIKYSAYAGKIKQMATLGDYLDILKPEK